MDGNNQDDATTKFMLAEYEDLYENVMHLENKLFAHLSFYTTLFMGVVTASIAILGLVMEPGEPVAPPWTLFLLALIFVLLFVVSRFELRMTTELRIRKMKFIEGLTQIRQYFVDKDASIAEYLVLPVGLHKAPPYLRIRSKDWYQVVYLSMMSGVVVLMGWILLLPPLVTGLSAAFRIMLRWALRPLMVCAMVTQDLSVPFGRLLAACLGATWLAGGLLLSIIVAYHLSYRRMMDFCSDYDKWREEKMGRPSEYDLFERPTPRSRLGRSLGDWLSLHEQRRRERK